MNAPGFVALLLPFVWMAWAASTTVLSWRAIRRDLVGQQPRVRVLAISTAASLLAFGATFLLPARIDSSGLLELAGGTEPWKGAAGEGLLKVVAYALPLDLERIILLTRATVIPACVLAALVAIREAGEDLSWCSRGLDLRTLLPTATLLVTPSFLYGTLGVFNFWFFGLVSLALLLAWQDLSRAPSISGRIALVCSVLLLGFARPETIVGGIVLASIAALFAAKKKDWRLVVPAVAALAILLAASPSVSGYLADRMRNQPLLTGEDATGSAPLWQLPWIATRRILAHAPVNLLVLLVALHALGVAAVTRAVRMIRARSSSWIEVAALGLVISEFLAIGVHREGFTRYVKYGQLLVVPCWYLAIRLWYARPPDLRGRKLVFGACLAGAISMSASLALTGLGLNRCSLPEGRTLEARRVDEVLLWNTTPRWAEAVCRGASNARVLVVGLDERSSRNGVVVEDALSKPACEPERWPVEHLLRRSGCAALAAYPDQKAPLENLLFDSSGGLLCRPVPFEGSGAGPQRPTHALVTYYRPEREAELRASLAAHPECPWEIVESTRAATLLKAR